MKRLEVYDTYEVPTKLIYVPTDFNCRDAFTPESCKSLADDIASDGLAIPVILQRVEDSQQFTPAGYEFRLVAGFRRHFACTFFLKWDSIPANVRPLTDAQAEVLNFTENLQRTDLNPLEEAKAIGKRFPPGTSCRAIGKEVKRNSRWVHTRLRLLSLPEHLQKLVAAKILSLVDVEVLGALPADEIEAAAKELIAAKGDRKVSDKRKVNPRYKRKFRFRRGKAEVNQRLEQLLLKGFDGLTTRFGAWFCGYISDDEFDADIAKAVKERITLTKRLKALEEYERKK